MLKRTGTIVNVEHAVDCSTVKIIDLGDVNKDFDFDQSHKQLQEKVTQSISVGAVPFVIGGGNDL